MTVILLEGPDGSGKTRTLRAMRKWMPYVTRFERACTSEAGPVADLRQWVDDRMPQLRDHAGPDREHVVLDRHPLVSELIYGPILRHQLAEGFEDPWLSRSLQEFAKLVVVVWHLPPLDAVRVNVHNDDAPQMSGVQAHIEEIYAGYQAMVEFSLWPGPRWLMHNYVRDPNHTRLVPELDRFAPMPRKDTY